MSLSSTPLEFSNWKPTASEIADLLISLGISPPQSLDGNFYPSNSDSRENSEYLDYGDQEDRESLHNECDNEILIRHLDRDTAIECLQIIIEEGKLIKGKNNYFHEYLIEHFKRKQMMHVYSDDSEEDDVLLNEYLKKLDELERSNEELRKSRDEWDAELSRTREDIRGKKEEARVAVNEMISKEREVGTSTWSCGKTLGLKRVQALIVRQLDRIRDIANFRLRYTRLRDELMSKETELRGIMISSPNLTKEDYERLEAEQFYYKRELSSKNDECISLMERRGLLANRQEAMCRKIVRVNNEIDNCQKAIGLLHDSVKMTLEQKRIWLMKLVGVKRFIREFNEIIGQSSRPEFASKMSNIRREHEEWMRKITKTLRDIKELGQELNAIRVNLMLHGKNVQSETHEKNSSLTPSTDRKNFNKQLL